MLGVGCMLLRDKKAGDAGLENQGTRQGSDAQMPRMMGTIREREKKRD